MATLSTDNIFQSWNLSQQEFFQGSILSILQKQCIQNQIAQLAQEKCLLKFTPNDVHTFLQQEAELQGKIGALSYLLTLSAEAEKKYDPGLQQVVINTSPDESP
jgi:hypothetical protein